MNGPTPGLFAVPVATVAPEKGVKVSDFYWQAFMEASKSIKCEVRLITPEWAKQTLEKNNYKNRNLKTHWRKIRAAIARLAWMVNGECIVFDVNGRMVNGQHRLMAIASGEEAVPCLIIHGVRPEAFDTFDQGKNRNAPDILSIHGHENCTTLAAALGWQNRYDAGRIHATGDSAIPNDLISKLADQYPEIIESVKFAKSCHCKDKMVPPGLMAFLHYQFGLRDSALRDSYFEKVVEGVGVIKPSHEFNLRRRLESDLSGRRASGDQIEIAALCVLTWNRLRQNSPVVDRIVWRTPKDGSITFPVIV